jgi:hypothetical protein
VAPRVDADHQVREPLTDSLDERHDPARLLGGVHDLTVRTRTDPADVHDVRALGDRNRDSGHRGLVTERGTAVVEGVPGAVDDGHHQRAVLGDLADTEPKGSHVSIVPCDRPRYAPQRLFNRSPTQRGLQ